VTSRIESYRGRFVQLSSSWVRKAESYPQVY